MVKGAQAQVGGQRFTGSDLSPRMAAFPLASTVLVQVMSAVGCRVARGKWSARRTLAFIALSSVLLWAMIIAGAILAARALSHWVR